MSLQSEFIDFAIQQKMLTFGDFHLKSGRRSPYFMNAGVFFNGHMLNRLARFYAQSIAANGIQFDVIFGPAYKGIPLASAAAMALAADGKQYPCIFDRKEAKDHGEGGMLMGQFRRGDRCLIIDDVLTAGTAVKQSLGLLRQHKLKPVGVLVLMDRQEKANKNGPLSAAEALKKEEGLKVFSIATASDMLTWLKDKTKKSAVEADQIKQIKAYLKQNGAPSAAAA